jgi:YD repeat-containing protein
LRPDATVTSIAYENPHYNRREREFFGFQTVTVKQHDPTGSRPVFRSIKYTYHNENYYLSGLLKATATYNSANQLLSEENTLYNLLDPDGPVVNFNATGTCMQAGLIPYEAALLDKSRLFVAMARSTTSSYEGSQRIWTTKSILDYDTYGNILTYTYSGADAYKAVITYQNNANFRAKYLMGLPKKISIYDSDGITLMRERNATCDLMGKMSKILVRLSNSYNTINFEYDSYGNMTKVIEFENTNSANTAPYEKNITYDDKVFTYPVTVGNSFGELSSTQYNYLFGIPVFSTDINGKSMRTRIDDRGRVVEVTGPNELVTGPNAWTIRMQYKNETPLSNNLSPTQFVVNANRSFVAVAPGATNPINSQHYAVTRHFDPEYAPPGSPVSSNELVTISIADGFGKALQVKKTHQVGSTMKWLISGFEKQDAFGRTLTSYLPAVQESYPTALGAYSSTDTGYYLPSSLQTSAEMLYDAKDRVVRIKQPSVSATQTPPTGESEFAQINYSISDNLVAEKLTNERGQTMETFTDSNGRQRKTVQNGQITTLYEYNAVNELIKVIDNQDAVTEYKYDLGGRKLEVRHPDRGVTLFKYDNAGRLIQQSNSNLQLAGGRFINYYYNFGRLVRIAYPQNPQNEVKYTYGAPGTSAAQINAVGRVMYQEDATGIQVFGYGNMGEVNRNLRSVAVAGYQSYWFYTTWKYDSWNRVQEIVYPDQEKVMYSYNKAGMLQGINSQIQGLTLQDIVRSITYNDLGERTVLEHGNGLKTYYTYDARRRLSTLKQVFAGSREITKKYEYDGLSNITSVKTVTPQNILPEPGESGRPYLYLRQL